MEVGVSILHGVPVEPGRAACSRRIAWNQEGASQSGCGILRTIGTLFRGQRRRPHPAAASIIMPPTTALADPSWSS